MPTWKVGLPLPSMMLPGAPGLSKERSRMYWPMRFSEGWAFCALVSSAMS
jgi:hypothetical protein